MAGKMKSAMKGQYGAKSGAKAAKSGGGILVTPAKSLKVGK